MPHYSSFCTLWHKLCHLPMSARVCTDHLHAAPKSFAVVRRWKSTNMMKPYYIHPFSFANQLLGLTSTNCIYHSFTVFQFKVGSEPQFWVRSLWVSLPNNTVKLGICLKPVWTYNHYVADLLNCCFSRVGVPFPQSILRLKWSEMTRLHWVTGSWLQKWTLWVNCNQNW